MDYCSGGELFQRIAKQKSLTEAEAAFYMRKILVGLNYIHMMGICHRDLKPENCLLTDDSEQADLKIIDFGMAKETTPE